MKEFMKFSFEAATQDGEEGFEIQLQFDKDFKEMEAEQQAHLLIGAHNSLTDVTRKAALAVIGAEVEKGEADAFTEGAKSPDEAKEMAMASATKRILDDEEPETVH